MSFIEIVLAITCAILLRDAIRVISLWLMTLNPLPTFVRTPIQIILGLW